MKQTKLNSQLELHVQFRYPPCKDAEGLASVQRKSSENSHAAIQTSRCWVKGAKTVYYGEDEDVTQLLEILCEYDKQQPTLQ